MAKNYQQDGTTLDFRIPVRPIFIRVTPCFQGHWWVSLTMTSRQAVGRAAYRGVFVLPKAAEAVTLGQKLYLADGKLTVEAGRRRRRILWRVRPGQRQRRMPICSGTAGLLMNRFRQRLLKRMPGSPGHLPKSACCPLYRQ
jgi:predicted RecA/RadA family phage recombinase